MKLIHLLRPPLPLPSFKESSEGYRVAGLVIEPHGYLYATVSLYRAPQIEVPVPAVAEPGALAMVLCGLVVLWRIRQ